MLWHICLSKCTVQVRYLVLYSVDWYGGSVNQWEVLLQKAQCTVWQVQLVALFISYKSNSACRVQFRLNVATVSTDPFSIFIPWLNLDFGIATCFIDGLDAYIQTVCLPVYIWVLVGLIILVSHYSPRFANLLGNNPVLSWQHSSSSPIQRFSAHGLLQLI